MERIREAIKRAKREQGTRSRQRSTRSSVSQAPKLKIQSVNFGYSKDVIVDLERPAGSGNGPTLLDMDDQDSSVAAYKLLRTRLLQPLRANALNTLMVVSPESGDGKSITAVNLALAFSRLPDLNVLLVDFDLRRPSVHHYLKFTPATNFSDFVTHDIELSDVIFETSVDKFYVLPSKKSIFASAELLSSPRVANTLETFKSLGKRWMVIIDSPPLLEIDDSLMLLPLVDANILVVQEGKSSQKSVQQSMKILNEYKCLGVVLNKSSSSQLTQYY